MKSKIIAEQASRPHGLLGYLVAFGMARETAPANRHAVELLELKPQDRVLEVGCGHGRTLRLIAERAPLGFVAGLDLSETMVRVARRHNRARIRAGSMSIRLGDGEALPYEAAEFDKALAMHTLYFWRNPGLHLSELRRVLKPGGVLVLGFHANDDGNLHRELPISVYRLYTTEQVLGLFRDTGFDSVRRATYSVGDQHYTFAIGRK